MTERAPTNNGFDVDLDDHELSAEILLLTDLMIAASESTQPLSGAVLDACLTKPR